MPSRVSALDYLDRVRWVVDRGWIQGRFAISRRDQPVAAWSEAAVAWCLSGAMHRVAHQSPDVSPADRGIAAWALLRSMSTPEKRYCTSITTWNDAPNRTKSEVLAAIDSAVKLLESEDS